ncbi:MAG: glycosyltransferase family 1 protein, partial [Pseudomonadota bacterium]
MHTYFFDVSDIVQYIETETSISGIQRVSLEVIRQMLLRYGPERVKMATWDRPHKRYHVLEADFLLEMDEFDPDVLSAVFFGRHVREA